MGSLLSKLPRQSKPAGDAVDDEQNVSAFGFSSDDSWYVSADDSYVDLSLAEFIKQQKTSGGDDFVSELKRDTSVDDRNHEGQGDITTNRFSNPTSESKRIACEGKGLRYKCPKSHDIGDREGTFVKTSCGENQTHNNASINQNISTDIGDVRPSFVQSEAKSDKGLQNTPLVEEHYEKNETDSNYPQSMDWPSRTTHEPWQYTVQLLGQTEHTCGEVILNNPDAKSQGINMSANVSDECAGSDDDNASPCTPKQTTLHDILVEAGLREDTQEIAGIQTSAPPDTVDSHAELEHDGSYMKGNFYNVGGQHESSEVTIECCSCQEESPHTTMNAATANNEYDMFVSNPPTSRNNEDSDFNSDVNRYGSLYGMEVQLTSGGSDTSAKIGAGDSQKSVKEDKGWIFQSIKSALRMGDNAGKNQIGDQTVGNDKYKDTNVDSGKGEVFENKGKRDHNKYEGDNDNAQGDSRKEDFGTVNTIAGKMNIPSTNTERRPTMKEDNRGAPVESFNFLADPKNGSFVGSFGGNKEGKTTDGDMESSDDSRKLCWTDDEDESDDGHIGIDQTNKSYTEMSMDTSQAIRKNKVDVKHITVEVDTGLEWKQTKPRSKTFRHFLQKSDSPTPKDSGVCGNVDITSKIGCVKEEKDQKRKTAKGKTGCPASKIERLERIYRSDSEESLELKELYDGGLLTKKEFDKMMTTYRSYGLVETSIDSQSPASPFLGKNYKDDHSYGDDEDDDINVEDNYKNDHDDDNDHNNYNDDDNDNGGKKREYWLEKLRKRNADSIVSEVDKYSKYDNDNNEFELSYREGTEFEVQDGISDATTCAKANERQCEANTDVDRFDYAVLDKILSEERKKRQDEVKINKQRQWIDETYTSVLDCENYKTSANEKESKASSLGDSTDQELREKQRNTDTSYFSIREDRDQNREEGFVRKEWPHSAVGSVQLCGLEQKYGLEFTAHTDGPRPYNINVYDNAESNVEETSYSDSSPYQNAVNDNPEILFVESGDRGDPEKESNYSHLCPSDDQNESQTSNIDEGDDNVRNDTGLNNLFHSNQSKLKFSCERLSYRPPDGFIETSYFLDDGDCADNDDDYALHGAWLKPLPDNNPSLNYYEEPKDAKIDDGNGDGDGNGPVDYVDGSRLQEDNTSCFTLFRTPNIYADGYERDVTDDGWDDAKCTMANVSQLSGHNFAWYTGKRDETPNDNDNDERESVKSEDGVGLPNWSPDQSSPQYTDWRNGKVGDDVDDSEEDDAIFQDDLDDAKDLQQKDCAVDDDKMQVLPGNPFSLLFKAVGIYDGEDQDGSGDCYVPNADLICNQRPDVRSRHVSKTLEKEDDKVGEEEEEIAEEMELQNADDNNGTHDCDKNDDSEDDGKEDGDAFGDYVNDKDNDDETNSPLPNPIDATLRIVETTRQYCEMNNPIDCDDDLDISANHTENDAMAEGEESNVTNNKLCENENGDDNAHEKSIPDNYDDFCQGRDDGEKDDKGDDEEDDEKEEEREEENEEYVEKNMNEEEVAAL